jgi:iron complex outermembrane receptor protein
MNIFRLGNGTDQNAESNFLEVDNQYQYRFRKDLLIITAGAPTSFGVSVSNLYPSQHVNYNSAAYVQGEFNYKIVSLQAGLRYEVAGLDSVFEKSQPVFRSGINIHAAKATWFRASWGQGYRIPSVAEKYLADPFTNGIVIIPNDTLHDEKSWSSEIGFRQGFKILDWKLFLDASLYYSQYKDFIEYQPGFYPNVDSHGNQLFPDSDERYGELIGIKPINIQNARLGGYELDLITNGKLGPVGVDILAGYTYTYPTSLVDTPGSYSLRDFWRDMFKYNFTRITNPTAQSHLLPYQQRQLFHADIQVNYWRAYLGTTLSFVSDPENANNQEYNALALFLYHDPDALSDYLAQHSHGDFIVDIRAGVKITQHFKMGFIVKNLTNRIYELRPGKTEPIRNYTLQFGYTF